MPFPEAASRDDGLGWVGLLYLDVTVVQGGAQHSRYFDWAWLAISAGNWTISRRRVPRTRCWRTSSKAKLLKDLDQFWVGHREHREAPGNSSFTLR
jgi:hypothetical protein